VNESAMQQAASDPFLLATDLADYLVKKEVPFRKAHEIIGKLTAYSLEKNKPFPDFTLAEFKQFSEAFEEDAFSVLTLEQALAARTGIGAPSPNNVASQLKFWREKISRSA